MQHILNNKILHCGQTEVRYNTEHNKQTPNIFVNNKINSNNKLIKLEKLGAGTYGTVYSAKDNFNSELAIKRNMIPDIYCDTAVNIRELDILLIVKEHPFCIQLIEYYFGNPFADSALSPIQHEDTLNDKIFFAMEKGDMDMNKWLTCNKCTIPDKKLLMVQTLLSVEFLHSRNIYHRDIKPANIIIFMEREAVKNFRLKSAKISDFGLSQFYDTQTMAVNNVVTIWYRAPEIALNKHHDTKVDVWSLGCIFFELFSGDGTQRLCIPKTDEELITFLANNFKMQKEDYTLSCKLYRNNIRDSKHYDTVQKNIPKLEKLFTYTENFNKNFDKLEINGIPNHGIETTEIPYASIKNYFDLLTHMLDTNPNKRYSATQCLNHPFFKGYESYIDYHRALFDINVKDGTWISKLPCQLLYVNDSNRKIAMNWFNIVFSKRNESPISMWWSNRLFFHAIDLFDRYTYIISENNKKCGRVNINFPENKILVIVITCLFICSKYFRIMLDNVGLRNFIIGFKHEHFPIIIKNIEETEEDMLKNVFKCRVYFPTIYEYATEHLSELAIKRLFEIIKNCELSSNMLLDECWKNISPEIKKINSLSELDAVTDIFPSISIDGL